MSYVVLVLEKYLKINTRKIFLAGLPFYETLGKEVPSPATAEKTDWKSIKPNTLG
jgi:hypothetical protein